MCKDWRELVQPFLFKHITLKRFSSLDALTQTMSEATQSGAPRGALVRRLDIIAPHDGHDTDELRTVRTYSQLRELLNLLPNLRSLTIRHSFSYRTGYALQQADFLSAISPALESISWIDEKADYSLLRVPESVWTPFLDSHPNLQSIHRPKVDVPSELYWNEPEVPLLSKPLVKVTQMVMRLEWTLSRPDLYLLHTEDGKDLYPNLHYLLFQMPIVGPMDMEMMGGEIPVPTMLEVHGHKITSMDCAYYKIISEDSPQLQFFPMIARHCTNLEELGLFLNWNSRTNTKGQRRREDELWSFALPGKLPTVRKLRVRRMNRKFDVGAYREMLSFVRKAVIGDERALPSCTTVQFASERDIVYIAKHKELLARGLESLAVPHLTLLDHRGWPLKL